MFLQFVMGSSSPGLVGEYAEEPHHSVSTVVKGTTEQIEVPMAKPSSLLQKGSPGLVGE